MLKPRSILITLIVFFLLALSVSTKPHTASAATLWWVGNDGANASVASNWKTSAPTSGTGCGSGDASTPPGSADTMRFDTDCDNGMTLDASFVSPVSAVTIDSGYSGTITQTTDLTVSSTFTTSGGTWNVSNKALTVTSTFTMNTGSTVYPSSGTTTFSAAFAVNGGTWNKDVNPGGTVVFDNAAAVLTCNNIQFNLVQLTTSINTNTKNVTSSCSLPLGANPTVPRLTLSGTLSGSGTITFGKSTTTFNSGAALVGFTGLISVSSPSTTLLIQEASFDFSSYTTFDVNDDFSLTSGSVIMPTQASIGGNFTVSGSPTFNANGGTIIFDGGAGNITCVSSTLPDFHFVIIANTSSAKTVGANCDIPIGHNPVLPRGLILNGTLSGSGLLTMSQVFQVGSTGVVDDGFTGFSLGAFRLMGGVFDASDATVFTVNDNFTLQNGAVFTAPGGTMTVDNDFSNSGTFNADGGTVELVGDLTQAIIGSTTFYNLVKNIGGGALSFNAGSTQTIAGNFRAQNVILQSSSAGSQWNIDAQGGRFLQNLSVQYSNSISRVAMLCMNCLNAGNNVNWVFSGGEITPLSFSLDSPGGNTHLVQSPVKNPMLRWRKAASHANSTIVKYQLFVQPKANNSIQQNMGKALFIDNIVPFITRHDGAVTTLSFQSPTYSLYDDGEYLNLNIDKNYYPIPLGQINFRIAAFDNAGNTQEEYVDFWIEPDIPTPTPNVRVNVKPRVQRASPSLGVYPDTGSQIIYYATSTPVTTTTSSTDRSGLKLGAAVWRRRRSKSFNILYGSKRVEALIPPA